MPLHASAGRARTTCTRCAAATSTFPCVIRSNRGGKRHCASYRADSGRTPTISDRWLLSGCRDIPRPALQPEGLTPSGCTAASCSSSEATFGTDPPNRAPCPPTTAFRCLTMVEGTAQANHGTCATVGPAASPPGVCGRMNPAMPPGSPAGRASDVTVGTCMPGRFHYTTREDRSNSAARSQMTAPPSGCAAARSDTSSARRSRSRGVIASSTTNPCGTKIDAPAEKRRPPPRLHAPIRSQDRLIHPETLSRSPQSAHPPRSRSCPSQKPFTLVQISPAEQSRAVFRPSRKTARQEDFARNALRSKPARSRETSTAPDRPPRKPVQALTPHTTSPRSSRPSTASAPASTASRWSAAIPSQTRYICPIRGFDRNRSRCRTRKCQ